MAVTHWGPRRQGETKKAVGQDCVSAFDFENNYFFVFVLNQI